MSKQQIHAWVDSEIYITLKSEKVNISSTVNNLLREYIDVKSETGADILKLQDELIKAKKERDNKNTEIELIAVKIAKLKEEREDQEREDQENRRALIESIKRSGVLNE